MEPIEYEIELERINGSADHTSANLPSLTKGQRLKVPVDGGLDDRFHETDHIGGHCQFSR
jgi:hypothetical protein